jgi:hypothetical protein
MLAALVFGSLGSGTWDAYSDLDLDVVVVDGVTIDVMEEVRRLCEALHEHPAVMLVDGRDDEVHVVLESSLMQMSVRYHPLHSTSPNIVDSMLILTGRIEAAAIYAAGSASEKPRAPALAELVSACVRLAVTIDAQLHRRQLWTAYSVLHLAREKLLQVFASSHGAIRPYRAFETSGDQQLKVRFGKTLPQDNLLSVQRALLCLVDLLEHDLSELSAGQISLTDGQHQVLDQLRKRQALLDLDTSA